MIRHQINMKQLKQQGLMMGPAAAQCPAPVVSLTSTSGALRSRYVGKI